MAKKDSKTAKDVNETKKVMDKKPKKSAKDTKTKEDKKKTVQDKKLTKTKDKKKPAEDKKKPAKEDKKKTEPEIPEEKTLEEELEETLSDEEIENFQIEKVDMERLTNRVCEILAEKESDGMFQSDLWKKLKLTSRDGSRLALKLERMGIITREKILEKGRWTYKLILKKTPISVQSIENAPCLVCPVEQKCSFDGEISPLTCQYIEDWVITNIGKSKSST